MNFGQNSDGTQNVTTALSDKPEVTSITPNFNTSGVAPNTSFTLGFSESMDTNSVEDNFIIRNREDYTFSTGAKFGAVHGPVYDESTYMPTWNSYYTEVKFTPKNNQYIPTDKDSAKFPSYYVSFKSPIKDIGGTFSRGINSSRITEKDTGIEPGDPLKDGPFRVTSVFKTGVPFSLTTDTILPKIENIIVSKTGINIKFTETMALFPLTAVNPFHDSNLLNPATYAIKVDKTSDDTFDTPGDTIQYQGQVLLNNPYNDTVTLQYDLSSYSGKSLLVQLNENITDPAGNLLLDNKSKSVIIP